jgi:ferric-dicitrate binding protein FerR (iron transport regulator)
VTQDNVVPFGSISHQAAQWLVELNCTEPRAELWSAFEHWISQSPQHRAEFLRLERAMRVMDRLTTLARRQGALTPEFFKSLGHEGLPPRRAVRWRPLAVGFLCLMALAAVIGWLCAHR